MGPRSTACAAIIIIASRVYFCTVNNNDDNKRALNHSNIGIMLVRINNSKKVLQRGNNLM